MRRAIIVFFLFILVDCTLSAQVTDPHGSMNSVSPKNSLYIENLVILPSINYDRIIPVGNKTGIVLKAGLTYYSDLILVMESSLLFGGKKHHFEIGAGWGGKDDLGLFGRVGYRYIGAEGLLFKGGIIFVKNVPIFPAIGLGFAF